ncbi:MAG: Hint domain-containing protein [Pelagimonas sp.]|jgi:hypothetical protein|nr:Hint domain-containing protein [Pelagimonas sp.]
MAFGEVGSLTRGGFGDGEEVRVDFTQPLDNAVIMLTGTNSGGNEYSFTITSVDATGFTFRLDEWEDEDGPHPATETINWIAVEPGVHTLPDGRTVEAGTATAVTGSYTPVTLNGGFGAPPVVLTSRMSDNDIHVADSDPNNITASGFDLRLQEAELNTSGNAGETVGYIAISAGGDGTSGTAQSYGNLTTSNQTFGLGHTFSDGITLAETQTINGPDPGNVQLANTASGSTTGAYFDEESGDGETNHVTESVGFVTFERGLIMCFTPGTLITTLRGQVDVALIRSGDLVLTRDDGFQPVRWISQTHLERARLRDAPELAPVLIRKDAFGPGLPAADMQVSPQHRMLVTGWKAQLLTGETEILAPAKGLINGQSVLACPDVSEVTYIHLLFDQHQVIYANGAPSESLHAGQIGKGEIDPRAREELFALFPDLRAFPERYGPLVRPSLRRHDAAALLH